MNYQGVFKLVLFMNCLQQLKQIWDLSPVCDLTFVWNRVWVFKVRFCVHCLSQTSMSSLSCDCLMPLFVWIYHHTLTVSIRFLSSMNKHVYLISCFVFLFFFLVNNFSHTQQVWLWDFFLQYELTCLWVYCPLTSSWITTNTTNVKFLTSMN